LLKERIDSVEDFAQKNLLGMLNFVDQKDRKKERKKERKKDRKIERKKTKKLIKR
jgi:hypothetical protein